VTRRWRTALVALRALVSPGMAMDVAGSRGWALPALGLMAALAALGAAALPRQLSLLAAALAPIGSPVLDAHAAALWRGLSRYVVADRLLPPLPFVCAAAMLAVAAAPVVGGRLAAGRAIGGVLVAGAAPLLVQRLGELALVWATPAAALAAGEIAHLPARFNLGVAGGLAIAGASPGGWASVAAEAANAPGLWVVALWGWGLSRLDRGACRRAGAPLPLWPFGLSLLAYGLGFALYAALFPVLLLVVMGAP
jgi:hypothetical protein